jgi:hypothetical protein
MLQAAPEFAPGLRAKEAISGSKRSCEGDLVQMRLYDRCGLCPLDRRRTMTLVPGNSTAVLVFRPDRDAMTGRTINQFACGKAYRLMLKEVGRSCGSAVIQGLPHMHRWTASFHWRPTC